MKKVTLKPTKEKSLLRKHPWVFSGAIKKIDEGIKDGDIVEVLNNKERYLCTGHYTEGTITVRAFEFKQQNIDEKYWKNKISQAYNQRINNITINDSNN